MPGTACLVTRWLEVECLVSAAAILLFQLVKSTILGCKQYTAHAPEVSGYACACGITEELFVFGNHGLQPCRRRMRSTSLYGPTTSSSNTAQRQQPVHTITSGMNPKDDELVQAKYTTCGKVIQATAGRMGRNSPSVMSAHTSVCNERTRRPINESKVPSSKIPFKKSHLGKTA